MELFDLTGKVAIVTGGNRGLGLGMAEGMARAGANIVIAARDEAKSSEAVDHIKSFGVEAEFIAVDVVDEASCHAMVAAAEKRFGQVDILVNNAGINDRKPPQDYSLTEWRKIIDTNYSTAYKIIEDNRDILDAMAAALVEFETIDTSQIDDLMARVPMREPADVVDSEEVSSELGTGGKDSKSSKSSSDTKTDADGGTEQFA